jgi:hypothetical protein
VKKGGGQNKKWEKGGVRKILTVNDNLIRQTSQNIQLFKTNNNTDM